MKKTATREAKSAALGQEEIVAYLKAHTTFFEQNIDLLAHLKIPHGQQGAISFLEYQAEILKQKHKKLHADIQDLLLIAEENEKLLRATLQFSVHLLSCTSLRHLLDTAEQMACHLFKVEVASIRFFENESLVWPAEIGVPFSQKEAEFLFGPFFASGTPWCGPLYPPQLHTLFDEKAEQVASSSLVILKTTAAPFGVFALGSHEKQRFHEGMGTLFLEFVGSILSHRVALFYATL